MTEIESPSCLVAAPGQDETIVFVKINNINLTYGFKSVSGGAAESSGKMANFEEAIMTAVIGKAMMQSRFPVLATLTF